MKLRKYETGIEGLQTYEIIEPVGREDMLIKPWPDPSVWAGRSSTFCCLSSAKFSDEVIEKYGFLGQDISKWYNLSVIEKFHLKGVRKVQQEEVKVKKFEEFKESLPIKQALEEENFIKRMQKQIDNVVKSHNWNVMNEIRKQLQEGQKLSLDFDELGVATAQSQEVAKAREVLHEAKAALLTAKKALQEERKKFAIQYLRTQDPKIQELYDELLQPGENGEAFRPVNWTLC